MVSRAHGSLWYLIFLRAGIMTSQYSFDGDHFHHRKRSLIQDGAGPFRLNAEGLAERFMCLQDKDPPLSKTSIGKYFKAAVF